MTKSTEYFALASDVLNLEARRIPWDSELLGYPVAEIVSMKLGSIGEPQGYFEQFNNWILEFGYGMISCRLSHERLSEAALLECNKFRFIETVLHPFIPNLQERIIGDHDVVVCLADAKDLASIGIIASSAFSYERFHVDPCLNIDIGNARYRRWVENSPRGNAQKLLKATLDGKIIGFFLVEYRNELVYWHLTALDPELKGKGLGTRVWAAMMAQHKDDGFQHILTTISARNVPVLNLYSKLNFRFRPPEMTFHRICGQMCQRNV